MSEATTAIKKETKLAKTPNTHPIVDEVCNTLRKDGFELELTKEERESIITGLLPALRASLTPRFKELEDRISTLEKAIVATAKKKN